MTTKEIRPLGEVNPNTSHASVHSEDTASVKKTGNAFKEKGKAPSRLDEVRAPSRASGGKKLTLFQRFIRWIDSFGKKETLSNDSIVQFDSLLDDIMRVLPTVFAEMKELKQNDRLSPEELIEIANKLENYLENNGSKLNKTSRETLRNNLENIRKFIGKEKENRKAVYERIKDIWGEEDADSALFFLMHAKACNNPLSHITPARIEGLVMLLGEGTDTHDFLCSYRKRFLDLCTKEACIPSQFLDQIAGFERLYQSTDAKKGVKALNALKAQKNALFAEMTALDRSVGSSQSDLDREERELKGIKATCDSKKKAIEAASIFSDLFARIRPSLPYEDIEKQINQEMGQNLNEASRLGNDTEFQNAKKTLLALDAKTTKLFDSGQSAQLKKYHEGPSQLEREIEALQKHIRELKAVQYEGFNDFSLTPDEHQQQTDHIKENESHEKHLIELLRKNRANLTEYKEIVKKQEQLSALIADYTKKIDGKHEQVKLLAGYKEYCLFYDYVRVMEKKISTIRSELSVEKQKLEVKTRDFDVLTSALDFLMLPIGLSQELQSAINRIVRKVEDKVRSLRSNVKDLEKARDESVKVTEKIKEDLSKVQAQSSVKKMITVVTNKVESLEKNIEESLDQTKTVQEALDRQNKVLESLQDTIRFSELVSAPLQRERSQLEGRLSELLSRHMIEYGDGSSNTKGFEEAIRTREEIDKVRQEIQRIDAKLLPDVNGSLSGLIRTYYKHLDYFNLDTP